MRYVLGIDIGSTRIAAGVCRLTGERWTEPEVVPPSGADSVVHVAADATVLVGRHALVDPERVARGFVRRVGDEVPFLLGEELYTAEALTAAVAGWVADQVAVAEGGDAMRVAVTHPPGWGAYRRTLLQDALHEAGMPGVLLLPAPAAVAESHLVRERVEPGTAIAVCRLGGEYVDTAVLRRGPSTFELVAHDEPADPHAGVALDDLLAEHLGGEIDRTICAEAKERLSTALEVMVGSVRLTRTEFERLIRPALTTSLSQLRRYEQLSTVLLAGGTARVPLVGVLAAEALSCRVVVDPDPATAACRGAALAARPRAEASPESTALVPRVSGFPELDPDEVYDVEPAPPRPPVVLTPLDPPRRRFLRKVPSDPSG